MDLHQPASKQSGFALKQKGKKVSFHTLGCRLNFSETSQIQKGFLDRGYEIKEFGSEVDLCFINTCTVTDDADSSCRHWIRKAHRSAPEASIIVAGCYAQAESEQIKEMPGVDLVLGTQEKNKVFEFLEKEEQQKVYIDRTDEFWGASTGMDLSKTRAFLKIQDGCNYICSFCIIPYVRGRSRSLAVKEVVLEAKKLVSSGFKEIVLTGVNVGEYERNTGEKLSDLILYLSELKELKRIRLSSVECNTFNSALIRAMADSGKVLNHFHIPLQSGDDETLKKMRRKYSTSRYTEVLEEIRDAFPGAAFGADIIAGFPGESEEAFESSCRFIYDSPLTHFHVFPFSRRKGTTAARLEMQLPQDLKKKRVRALISMGKEKKEAYALKSLGTKNKVLFERRNKAGLWEGYTSHFIKTTLKSEQNLQNEILDVELESFDGQSFQARADPSF